MINFLEIKSSFGSIIETNNDIEDIVNWSSEDIYNKTGIRQRYISSDQETAESLAIDAAKKISNDLINKCELIISVTNTQSIMFPAIANFVHSELGLSKGVKCIGINSGCSGFVDALEIIYSLFKSGKFSNALLINSDTYSKFLNNNRSTRTLFSDGATATFIEKNINIGWRIIDSVSSSIKNSQTYLLRHKVDNLDIIEMNGPKVLQFAISNVLKEVRTILPLNSSCIYFPHQAGKIVLSLIKKKMPKNIDLKCNFENHGNLVSASIPNLMKDNFIDINDYETMLLSGFGVGLTHNSILFEKL